LPQVGLFQVQPNTLPASWQVDPSAVPRLGASPDGLIVHKVSLEQQAVQTAAAALHQLQQQQQVSGAADCGEESGQQHLLQGMLSAALDAVPCAGFRPLRGVPLASSSEDEGPAGENNAAADGPDSSGTVSIQSATAGSSSADDGQDVSHSRRSSFMQDSSTAPAELTEGVLGADSAAGSNCRSDSETVIAAAAIGTLSREQPAPDATKQASVTLGASTQVQASPGRAANGADTSATAAASVQPSAAGHIARDGVAQTVTGAEQQAKPSLHGGALLFEPIAEQLLRLLHQQQRQASTEHSTNAEDGNHHQSSVKHEEVAGSSSSISSITTATNCPQAAHVDEKLHVLYVREVVEVKSHCPFSFRQVAGLVGVVCFVCALHYSLSSLPPVACHSRFAVGTDC
jgi:hypothetical protein